MPDRNIKDAMDLVVETASNLSRLGFTLTGSIAVSKAPATGRYERYDSPDGRYSQLRYVPAALGANKPPNPPIGTKNGESIAGIVPIAIGATPTGNPGDGLTRDGSLCGTCSGSAFERRGACLYCTNCGSSVGGCG